MKHLITLSLLGSSLLLAGGNKGVVLVDNIPVVPIIQSQAFFQPIEGYLRIGYQQDGHKNSDLAIGGKLHIETTPWYGLSIGATGYSTNLVNNRDHGGTPAFVGRVEFFDGNTKSYTILGEAYIKAVVGNTVLKAGRQVLETPFTQEHDDDYAMIPNTFEASMLTNTDIQNTTLVLGYIQKMSGVDAVNPGEFTDTNMNKGIYTAGVKYNGFSDLSLQAWYYNVKDTAGDRDFSYLDALYASKVGDVSYGLGVQYSTQEAFAGDAKGDASIYGLSASLGLESTGLRIGTAFNATDGTTANNGFGTDRSCIVTNTKLTEGPFMSSAEHLSLANAGANGEALLFSLDWEGKSIGIDELSLGARYLTLKEENNVEKTELDLFGHYEVENDFSLDIVYSKVDCACAGFYNTKVIANYYF
jgi:hypothetical protein